MKKIILTLALIISIVTSVDAAKSSSRLRKVQQPDGTTLMVSLQGDENACWYETADGVLLTCKDNVYYIAEVTADGKLSSTGVIAHNLGSRSDNEVAMVKAQDKTVFSTAVTKKINTRRKIVAGYPSTNFCPHKGNIHIPVILVQFPDTAFTYSKEVMNDYFNSTTKTSYTSATRFDGYSSVGQYFADASNGNFTPVFDLYGPYTVAHPHTYYGCHASDLDNNDNETSHTSSIMQEAIKLADDDIDFSQYDSDNNGKVDMVYLCYAGASANLSGDARDIWAACHYGISISTADDKIANVVGYACELALSAKDAAEHGYSSAIRAGVGVTCHEMSHGLGLPDLYWTLGSNNLPKDALGYTDPNNCGPEDWDLMDGGENIFNGMWPCQYNAWEREIMGWLDVEDLTYPADVTIYPLNKDGGKAYRVTNPADKNEYYIIENMMHSGWNFYLSNKYGTDGVIGLIITHVTTTNTGLTMSPNNTYGHPNVTILPADGFILASYSKGKVIRYQDQIMDMSKQNFTKLFQTDMKGDPYPGSQKVDSVAAYKNYTGTDMVETYPITDIKMNADYSVSFKFMGGTSSGIRDIVVAPTDSRIYTIDGQYVGTDRSSLRHGIYIQNGKKFIK